MALRSSRRAFEKSQLRLVRPHRCRNVPILFIQAFCVDRGRGVTAPAKGSKSGGKAIMAGLCLFCAINHNNR
jgi:hypothetical protein